MDPWGIAVWWDQLRLLVVVIAAVTVGTVAIRYGWRRGKNGNDL